MKGIPSATLATSSESNIDEALAVKVILIFFPLTVMSVYIIRSPYKYVNGNRGFKCTPVTSTFECYTMLSRLNHYHNND